MLPLADVPTLGLLIGGPLVGLIILFALAAAVFGGDEYDRIGFIIGGVGVALITAVIALSAFWPLRYEYHFWQPKNGVVQAVSQRLVPTDNGMEQKFVVVIDGQPYGITDTRAALLKPGDPVSLSCKRAYQWGSADHGWDCRWNGGV